MDTQNMTQINQEPTQPDTAASKQEGGRKAYSGKKNARETCRALAEKRHKDLSPYALARLGRPYEAIDEATGKTITRTGPLPLRPVAKKLAEELGCGVDWVFEMVSVLAQRGPENVDPMSLLKKGHNGAPGVSRLPAYTEQVMVGAITRVCFQDWRSPSKRDTIEEIQSIIKADPVIEVIPSLKTIRRRIKVLQSRGAFEDPFNEEFLRKIPGTPEEGRGPLSTIVGDCTELCNDDHEVVVVDDAGNAIGKAGVIFLMSVATRMVYSYLPYVGMPNAYLMSMAILRGIQDKEPLMKKLKVEGSWLMHGIPGEFRSDHGSESYNETVTRVVREIGCPVKELTPVKTPNFNGKNERFHRTAQTMVPVFMREPTVLRKYGVTVRKRPRKRTEYHITFDNLDRALCDWIVNVYHKRSHSGLGGDSPEERHLRLISGKDAPVAAGLPPAPTDTLEFRYKHMLSARRKVTHLGIHFEGRRYVNPKFSALFARSKRTSDGRIEFRYNPYEMGTIYVRVPTAAQGTEIVEVHWLPETERFSRIPGLIERCRNPSEWEWRSLRKVVRKLLAEAKLKESIDLTAITEEIHKGREIDAEEAKKRGSRSGLGTGRQQQNREMGKQYGGGLPSAGNAAPEGPSGTVNTGGRKPKVVPLPPMRRAS